MLRKSLLSPGIFLDKSLTPRPEKLDLIKKLKNNGNVITSLDEESGILGDDYASFASKRYSRETVQLADALFFWGPHDFAYMKEAHGQFADHFHMTGNPRVDMWRPEMAAFFDNSVPNPRPYILLPSNFGSVFRRDDLHVLIKRLRRTGYIKEGCDRDSWEARTYRFWREGVELGWEFIKAIRLLARRFPEADFIVRPHPVESPERWRELLQPNDNIIIRAEGSISSWIRHAKGVINHGCTSAIELSLSGTPLVSYEPVSISNPERNFPKRLGSPAATYSDLENITNLMLQERHQATTEADFTVLASRLAAITGALAAERIVDVWDKIDDISLRKGGLWAHASGSRIRALPHRINPYGIISGLGISNSFWHSWKFKPFDLQSVLQAKAQLTRSLNRFEKIPSAS